MNENPIVECFAVAKNNLSDAIDRQRQRKRQRQRSVPSETMLETDASTTTTTTSTSTKDDSGDPGGAKDLDPDEDDMAAAYFAMQANKQRDEERQNEKILDDWATIILRQEQRTRTRQRQQQQQRQREAPPAATANANANAVDEFESSPREGGGIHPDPGTSETRETVTSAMLADELIAEFQRILRS